MSINTTPDSRLSQLAELAKAIHQAADDQHWDQLAALLPRFDAQARGTAFSSNHAAQLRAISAAVEEARGLATARRDEIGQLLDGLTGKR